MNKSTTVNAQTVHSAAMAAAMVAPEYHDGHIDGAMPEWSIFSKNVPHGFEMVDDVEPVEWSDVYRLQAIGRDMVDTARAELRALFDVPAFIRIQTSERGSMRIVNLRERLEKFAATVKTNQRAFGGGIAPTKRAPAAITWPANAVKVIYEMIQDKDIAGATALAIDKAGALFYDHRNTPMMFWAPVPVDGMPDNFVSARRADGEYRVFDVESGLAVGLAFSSRKRTAENARAKWETIKPEDQARAIAGAPAGNQAAARAEWFRKHGIETADQAAEREALQAAERAAAAVAASIDQAAAMAFLESIATKAADDADQAPAECVAMADQELAAMACADGSGPMASAAADRGATHAPGGRGASHAGPSSSKSGAMPLHGHAYHGKTSAQLRYIISDAGEAARNMRGMDPAAECKYLDQVNDACTVLRHRGETGQAPDPIAGQAPTLAQAAANVDNPAPTDAPTTPAADTPADPGPAATMPPAIGASQAPDYSDGRKTSSALHDTPQDLDPGAAIPPAVDLDALDLDTLSTAAAQALRPEMFTAMYDALEDVNHHNGALQLRALRAGNKAIADQVAAIERECIKAGHLTPELELRRRALSALVRHIEQRHVEASALHGIAPGGNIAPKITAKHIHHHIRTTPGNSIGSVEMLAGVDICSQMERTALWSKFRHLYAGDSQTLIDAVMAECHKRAARLVNDGALCLWRPRI